MLTSVITSECQEGCSWKNGTRLDMIKVFITRIFTRGVARERDEAHHDRQHMPIGLRSHCDHRSNRKLDTEGRNKENVIYR